MNWKFNLQGRIPAENPSFNFNYNCSTNPEIKKNNSQHAVDEYRKVYLRMIEKLFLVILYLREKFNVKIS